jgi:energy-coupling factor transporter ATP-binding protein EcfA2
MPPTKKAGTRPSRKPKSKARAKKKGVTRKAATKRKAKAPARKKTVKKRATSKKAKAVKKAVKSKKKATSKKVTTRKKTTKKKGRKRRGKKTTVSSGAPQYLLSIDVENIRCFGPTQTLQLSGDRSTPYAWTVIFGDNGAGKTTLLQAVCSIASTLQDRKEVPSFIRYNWRPQRRATRPAQVTAQVLLRPRETAPFTVRYAPQRRRTSPPPRWDFDRDGTLNYCGYGASRRHGQAADSGRKPLESSGDESLFIDDAELLNAEEWFVQMSHFGPARRQLREARAAKKVRDLLASILLDVSDIRIASRQGRAAVEFKTHFGWVPMKDLSMGYRTLIAWIVDYARRLYVLNPRSSNPLAAPAVVCVDEIDLHLHQRWQRNLMSFLSETFPKTQFICTAHNRTVAQAVPRDANLVLLRRKGDHVEIHNHAAELLEGVR